MVTGAIDEPAQAAWYAAALPGARLTVIRLDAGPDALLDRALSRGRGASWRIPGDRLKGLDAAALREVASAAARRAADLARRRVGDAAVRTDGRTVEETTEAVFALMAQRSGGGAAAGWRG